MDIVCTTSKPVGHVLVVHSWWGLTPSFYDYADRLAEHGFAVGLTDLFDGRTADDIAQAQQLRRAPRRVPMYRTLIADIDHLRAAGGRTAPSVAVIGFSMGGHWAVWLSQRRDLPIRATVLYYAARAGSFASSQASFLAHFAKDDPWVRPPTRRRMEKAIAAAGRPYQAFDYPGTRHWFAEAGRQDAYHPDAAALALDRTIAHLKTA